MRKFSFLTLLLIGLAGCANAPSKYGNFIQNTVMGNDKKIADDVVKKFVALYPPASTRFDLQQATPDFFGTYLVQAMRAKGYAVLEFKTEPKTATSVSATPETVSPSPAGISLAYVMVQAKGSDLYVVTLEINHKQFLDRAYQLQDGVIYPAGYWVRKE